MNTITTLSQLPLGRSAYINSIDFDTNTRRRFLDLGFVKGNMITPLFKSPLGDPAAYKITDSIIALRTADAARITVNSFKEEFDG